MKIRFDHGPDGAACMFARARRLIVAHTPEDVPGALDALDAALDEGSWLAGYASYELGFALEASLLPLMPGKRGLPLLQFGVYDWPSIATSMEIGPAALSDFEPVWDNETYQEAFAVIHEHICAGDFYQANLTFPIELQAEASSEVLYRSLSEIQAVRFGALVQQDEYPDLLSRSPELFFRTDTQGRIQTRPMKGTQPRADDPIEDARRRFFLQTDEKNRAENLMIVDLLRNDLSRVCQAGSVQVPELFSIETYKTVHQMTSLISGQLEDSVGLADVIRALFPCGSITGAPKLSAMQVLAQLEEGTRDIYCGSIGWAAPDGRAEFNVAIRTLMLDEDGRARLNVGGGVVYDSTSASEYEEALWKARFVQPLF